jgi:SP family general alpha glucoside:H+ symporter-like MFS transporter
MRHVVTQVLYFRTEFGSIVDGSYILPALWLGLWTSMIQVGAMAGSLISGPISNRWGRKIAYGLGGFIVAAGMSYMSTL